MSALDLALSLIIKYEDFKPIAYKCPRGVWTVGYGSTWIKGRPVVKTDTITEPEAFKLMFNAAEKVKKQVLSLVKVPLTENQLASLISLVYNAGIGDFQKSKMLKKLNLGDYTGASLEFDDWTHVNGKVLGGLVKRRAEEKALFLKP